MSVCGLSFLSWNESRVSVCVVLCQGGVEKAAAVMQHVFLALVLLLHTSTIRGNQRAKM